MYWGGKARICHWWNLISYIATNWYLGILRPTTPATTGPEWTPILMWMSSPDPGTFRMVIPSIMSNAMSQILRAWLAALLGHPATIRYASPDQSESNMLWRQEHCLLTYSFHFVDSILITEEVKQGVHVVQQLHNLEKYDFLKRLFLSALQASGM